MGVEARFRIAAMAAAAAVAGLGAPAPLAGPGGGERRPIRLRRPGFGGQGGPRCGRGHSNRKIGGGPPPDRFRGDEDAVSPVLDGGNGNARAQLRHRVDELVAEAHEARRLLNGAVARAVLAGSGQAPCLAQAMRGRQCAFRNGAPEQPLGAAFSMLAMVCVRIHDAHYRAVFAGGDKVARFFAQAVGDAAICRELNARIPSPLAGEAASLGDYPSAEGRVKRPSVSRPISPVQVTDDSGSVA